MLGELWVYLFVILLGIGFAVRNEVMVTIGGIGVALCAGAWLWSRLAVERLSYSRTLSQHRAFPGEELTVRMAITNRKRIPLARVRVVDTFPAEVELGGHKLRVILRGDVLRFSRSTSIGPYERVRWTYTMCVKRRGIYRIGPAELQTSDLFGIFLRTVHLPDQESLLVFPSTIPLPELSLDARRPVGEERGSALHLHADPSRPAGVREYQPGDPPKHIDWKASAHRNTLLVKQFEPGASNLTALFINCDTVGVSYGGVVALHLERAVAVAASITERLALDGQPLAVYTNSKSVLVEHPMRVPPGRHAHQHALIQETLAMVGPFLAGRIEEELLTQARRLPAGTTLVLITGFMTPELSQALELLARMRRAPVVLWVAAWEPENLPGGVRLVNLAEHLAELEASGQAPYLEGLESRGARLFEEGNEQGAAESATAERTHLEARNVPMA
ncbi:MAG: DUF58 domain-containing protein [Dehalococcoidia bacterium]|nr:DUF58 domain-containing protein [Dehalococcoidia bacterium]